MPGKKTAAADLQLWTLSALAAFVLCRGCVRAASRRGHCQPSWPPCSLPCFSPAGEITKEIVNSRQPLAGGLQAGLVHVSLMAAGICSARPRPDGHAILPATDMSPHGRHWRVMRLLFLGLREKRHPAGLHSFWDASTDTKQKGFANQRDGWLLELKLPGHILSSLILRSTTGRSASCLHCSFVRRAAYTERRKRKNVASDTHFGNIHGD